MLGEFVQHELVVMKAANGMRLYPPGMENSSLGKYFNCLSYEREREKEQKSLIIKLTLVNP